MHELSRKEKGRQPLIDWVGEGPSDICPGQVGSQQNTRDAYNHLPAYQEEENGEPFQAVLFQP